MAQLRIDIWSDIACPWCYVGKRRLEKALADFPQRENVHIVWRAFELNPSAQRESSEGTYSERLAKKYGTSTRDAESMISRMTDTAKAEGLNFDFEVIRSGNTFDAHRLLQLALTQDLQNALKERLLRAYFSEGEAIGDSETLLRLAVDTGMEAEKVRGVLESHAFSKEVREDEAEAQELGIRGVPFFVLAERYAVSGAQPAEVLLQALEQAQLAIEEPLPEYSEGAVCGPEGC
jgi:predicted DsbA family dithiol-disulfide isomerase